LHLCSIENVPASTEPMTYALDKTKQALTGTVTDYIGLAMANLKLRDALRPQRIG